MSKKLTRQGAINAFCRECIYDPHGGNGSWLNQVEGCTAAQCPLFEYRPLTSATKQEISDERFNALSPEEQAVEQAKRDLVGERFAKSKSAEEPPEIQSFL